MALLGWRMGVQCTPAGCSTGWCTLLSSCSTGQGILWLGCSTQWGARGGLPGCNVERGTLIDPGSADWCVPRATVDPRCADWCVPTATLALGHADWCLGVPTGFRGMRPPPTPTGGDAATWPAGGGSGQASQARSPRTPPPCPTSQLSLYLGAGCQAMARELFNC